VEQPQRSDQPQAESIFRTRDDRPFLITER
jgi:hypothetical protein